MEKLERAELAAYSVRKSKQKMDASKRRVSPLAGGALATGALAAAAVLKPRSTAASRALLASKERRIRESV